MALKNHVRNNKTIILHFSKLKRSFKNFKLTKKNFENGQNWKNFEKISEFFWKFFLNFLTFCMATKNFVRTKKTIFLPFSKVKWPLKFFKLTKKKFLDFHEKFGQIFHILRSPRNHFQSIPCDFLTKWKWH